MAINWENRLKILNPGISFVGNDGQEKGPVVEWNKRWVLKGWATRSGHTCLPRSPLAAAQPHCMRLVTPIAWRVPTALFIAYTWIRRRRPITNVYDASAVVQHPPEWFRVVCDWLTTCQRDGITGNRTVHHRPPALALRTTAVVYTDGAYSAARGGGSQQAGFGISVVRGGDGNEDRDAREEMSACGCVILTPHCQSS